MNTYFILCLDFKAESFVFAFMDLVTLTLLFSPSYSTINLFQPNLVDFICTL